MKGYFRMKYEQFLMRLFDKIVNLISKTRVAWYPEDQIKKDQIEQLEDRIHDLESENDKMFYYLTVAEERVEELSKKLYYYEPWEEDDMEEYEYKTKES